jgi:hypothetical protein
VRHGGKADVVRQELAADHGLAVSPRTVERACAPFRQQMVATLGRLRRLHVRAFRGKAQENWFGESRSPSWPSAACRRRFRPNTGQWSGGAW